MNNNQNNEQLNANEGSLVKEDELNSDDDVSDDGEDLDNGRNILLAYYEKNVRKRDRRKITFKHCILRINVVLINICTYSIFLVHLNIKW